MVASMQQAYAQLQAEASRLAGGLTDVAQRAAVYRHMYRFSGGNHVFPLIAAHGALWSRGYFQMAHRLAIGLSWQYLTSPSVRRQKLEQLEAFENVLRDINRRVCVDTYVNLHFTVRYGEDPRAELFVPAPLREAMQLVHRASQAGQPLTDAEKQVVFEAHFRNEQAHVVGPALTAAVAEFEWPVVRAIALRPPIRFTYFAGRQILLFRDFSNADERIAHGLRAFRFGAAAGWPNVEAALSSYRILPSQAFAAPDAYFDELRGRVLTAIHAA